MLSMTRWLLVAALMALATPGLVRAEEGKKLVDRLLEGEPKTDKEFLIRTIHDNSAEIRCAEMVAKRTENAEVRTFANKLVEDHKSLRTDLMAQAKAQKIAVVEGLDKAQREALARLAELKGVEQDREFLKHQIECHEKGLRMYERWAKVTTDTDLRDVATRAVRMVRTHLEQARKLHAGLKS